MKKLIPGRQRTGEKNRRDGSCNTNGQVTLSGAPLLANLIMARRYIVARRSYHSCSRCVRSHPAADTWSVLRAGVAGQIPAGLGYLMRDLRHRDIVAVSFFKPSRSMIYLYRAYARIHLDIFILIDISIRFADLPDETVNLSFLFLFFIFFSFFLIVTRDPKRLHIRWIENEELIENWFHVKKLFQKFRKEKETTRDFRSRRIKEIWKRTLIISWLPSRSCTNLSTPNISKVDKYIDIKKYSKYLDQRPRE